MLSIQPVNLTNHYSFKGYERLNEDDYAYSRANYESDRSVLEEHLQEINDVIENTEVPKPVRVMGKIASIGIGAGLGFVSMKFGAQGVVKLGKKGLAYAKKVAEKPLAKRIITDSKDLAAEAKNATKDLFTKANEAIKNTKVAQKVTEKVTKLTEKYEKTAFAGKMRGIAKEVSESKIAQNAKKLTETAKAKVKAITPENIENGVVNLFAVSGGVTGGITALQESVKKDA